MLFGSYVFFLDYIVRQLVKMPKGQRIPRKMRHKILVSDTIRERKKREI